MTGPTFPQPSGWGSGRKALNALLLLSLALGSVTAPEAWAFDLYVATSGDDQSGANDCRTLASPCKTLTHALTQASGTTADVVNVAAGLYDTPTNGESFPLALVDGVAILGDTANPASRTISAPANTSVFYNDGTTALGPATRLAGFALTHDGSVSIPTDQVIVEFGVTDTILAPQIDHNSFAGFWDGSHADTGIYAYDASTLDGSFIATIDNNTFTAIYEAIQITQSGYGGAGDTYSPAITNNTFTGCGFPTSYTLSSSAEGTVGGRVSGNTTTSSTHTDIWTYVSPAYSRGVTFSPTIENNTFAAGISNLYLSAVLSSVSGDVSISPTVTGNTMTATNGDAIHLYFSTMSVSTSAQVTVSPTITDNSISHPGGDGVDFFLYYLYYGTFVSDLTISNNTLTDGSSMGIEIYLDELSYAAGIDARWTVADNLITAPDGDGINLETHSLYMDADSGTFDLTIAGNTITGAQGDGLYVSINSWYSDANVDQRILIQGNTVTGCTGDGLSLSLNGQTGLASNDVRVVDNVFDGNGEDGMFLGSDDYGSNPILVSCNTITGSTENGINQGGGTASYYDPPADYGGGNLGSPGANTISGNGDGSTYYDFYNEDDDPVSAQGNWWGTTSPATIAANVYDNADDGTKGAVDTSSFLSAEPSVALSAALVDAVVVDVAPAGASVGDTILYTATVSPALGSCGDLALTFTVPVPANATLVPDSVTTTRGAVTATSPVTVAIGPVTAGETITITWEVVADSGTQLSSQGTVTATRSGSTLSNDPDTATAADPTVTLFEQQQGAEPIPTLGQWGLALLGVALLLFGAALLRRRRFAAATLVLAMALGAGWVGAASPDPSAGTVVGERTIKAATLGAATASNDAVTLSFTDGTTLTVPRRALRVHDLRNRPDLPDFSSLDPADRLIERTKLRAAHEAAKAQRENLSEEQRTALRRPNRLERVQQKLARAAAARSPLLLLTPSAPVVLEVARDRDGTVRDARVRVYASDERARDEAERAVARREARRPRN